MQHPNVAGLRPPGWSRGQPKPRLRPQLGGWLVGWLLGGLWLSLFLSFYCRSGRFMSSVGPCWAATEAGYAHNSRSRSLFGWVYVNEKVVFMADTGRSIAPTPHAKTDNQTHETWYTQLLPLSNHSTNRSVYINYHSAPKNTEDAINIVDSWLSKGSPSQTNNSQQAFACLSALVRLITFSKHAQLLKLGGLLLILMADPDGNTPSLVLPSIAADLPSNMEGLWLWIYM